MPVVITAYSDKTFTFVSACLALLAPLLVLCMQQGLLRYPLSLETNTAAACL